MRVGEDLRLGLRMMISFSGDDDEFLGAGAGAEQVLQSEPQTRKEHNT